MRYRGHPPRQVCLQKTEIRKESLCSAASPLLHSQSSCLGFSLSVFCCWPGCFFPLLFFRENIDLHVLTVQFSHVHFFPFFFARILSQPILIFLAHPILSGSGILYLLPLIQKLARAHPSFFTPRWILEHVDVASVDGDEHWTVTSVRVGKRETFVMCYSLEIFMCSRFFFISNEGVCHSRCVTLPIYTYLYAIDC